ncbi:MAG: bifunctional 4-hydroxy-2-oxoglutarate aldolase/2-dehydro-3-deoxy-phosphogluconate aldolase [Clostridia bacterium]|nr:bifunctional 4-hydroxy-2-oxoglutarate aldolase/2-dehydro-3-deoxy-phosphogluconate aldolase [Clostridia bacterium]
MKNDVIKSIPENKLIVIIRGVEENKLLPLVKAMYDGGVRLVELTYDNSGKVEDSRTAKNIAMLKEHFGDTMHIGAGTVTDTKKVELTYKAGGEFIISPDTNEAVIKAAVEHGVVSIPGALTPTEIQKALNCGADFVKLFPVTSMGPEYVKAVKAPLSNIKMLAVGGIDLDNIKAYLKCGICGFGIGSNIIDKKLLASSDYGAITALAEKYVNAVRG